MLRFIRQQVRLAVAFRTEPDLTIEGQYDHGLEYILMD